MNFYYNILFHVLYCTHFTWINIFVYSQHGNNKNIGPISHPLVKSVVKCMVITRLSKWFGIELYCVSTDRVSHLAAIEWFRSQRLTTGYLVIMGGDQPHNKRSWKYRGMQGVISYILILRDNNITWIIFYRCNSVIDKYKYGNMIR